MIQVLVKNEMIEQPTLIDLYEDVIRPNHSQLTPANANITI